MLDMWVIFGPDNRAARAPDLESVAYTLAATTV
jgi:hypothetical protein